jgi:uncharacterized protein YukE
MSTWGANSDQLDGLAGAVERAAELLDANRSRLNSQVHHAPWRGHQADQFRREWDSLYVRNLTSAAAFLHSASTRLRRNAEEQRQASAAPGRLTDSGGTWASVLRSLHRNPFSIAFSHLDLATQRALTALGLQLSFLSYVGGSLFDLWSHSKSVIDEGKTLLKAAEGADLLKDAHFGPLDLLATIPDVLEADKYLAVGNYPDTFWAYTHVGVDVASSYIPVVGAFAFGFYTAAPWLDHQFGVSDHASSFVVGNATENLYGADPNHLTVQQATQYAKRYDGVSGFFHMANDVALAPGENVAKGFLSKIRL